ncbi:MAG TPA: TIGR00282 family metallophosphoesterase [Planctomycetota bacterium]|nr:TIGR00282 family metallophosphoesterase [Planctomycetota bacterium]
MPPPLTILFFGDVVGRPGRKALCAKLPELRTQYAQKNSGPVFVVVNGENSANGSGITRKIADQIFQAGADVITTGDHFFRNQEFKECLDDRRILRPANIANQASGFGYGVYPVKDTGAEPLMVLVFNLIGRIFLDPADNPFDTADRILADVKGQAKIALLDMHAEATSEKVAMGWHLDGKVSAIIGTHTHIQTADERILPAGSAYLTDAGMCGPYDSVIGRQVEPVLKKFRTGMPARFEVAENNVILCGAAITVDRQSGLAQTIERFRLPVAPIAGS